MSRGEVDAVANSPLRRFRGANSNLVVGVIFRGSCIAIPEGRSSSKRGAAYLNLRMNRESYTP